MASRPRFKTFGLTHIALKVRDIERSVEFYRAVFGCKTMYLEADFAQVTTPGSSDVIVFERSKKTGRAKGDGIIHFGFRLIKPIDIEIVRSAVEAAGGKVKDFGEFEPGAPYLFFDDPDGYEVEVWYEKS